ncbi:MAG: hypothetical protein ACLGSA_12550 [Acidobacteriota bacterium]
MTMRVRLLTRWGSRMQGDIVSVSDERGKYLESEGIGKMMDPLPEPEKGVEAESETLPEPEKGKSKK